MLPTFKLVINPDDDTGVDFVAFVDEPAIEKNFLYFNKQKYAFKIENEERRIVSGPLLIPDKPIYRRDKEKEYNVIFDTPTVYNIVQKFFKNQHTKKVNEMHNKGSQPEGVYMFESFIIDKNRGISPPKGYEDLPEGTWFGSYKVDNDQVWQSVKTGEFQGFSVEGQFIYEALSKQDDFIDELIGLFRTL